MLAKPAVCHSQRAIAYNVYMPSLTLVIPFALPPQALARDLLSQLSLPALAKLLARAQRKERHDSETFAASLPHEQWLSGQLPDSSPPIAHTLMKALDRAPSPGVWFVTQPVHLHIARDHLVLTDHRRLYLNQNEAQELFDSVQPLFEEQDLELLFGNAHYWFIRADAWSDFRTCTPDAACGHNIDIWQPSGSAAREWRRLHNEVQMLWHQHPLNLAREERGELRVNALWLWGASAQEPDSAGCQLLADAIVQGGEASNSNNHDWRLINALTPLALAEDWSGWLQQMQQLEALHFAPALAQLASGELEELRLVFSDAKRLEVWSIRRSGMRKFWLSPSLSRLAS